MERRHRLHRFRTQFRIAAVAAETQRSVTPTLSTGMLLATEGCVDRNPIVGRYLDDFREDAPEWVFFSLAM